MALKIKNEFIKEEIIDENNEKIGELKFNPKDSRIMKILTEAIVECTEGLKEIDKLGDIKQLSEKDLDTIEDYQKEEETFRKIDKGYDIELKTIESIIDKLSTVFGKETIELFTQGSVDIDSVMPVIEFVMPYVKKDRNKKIEKYMKKSKNKNIDDVME